MNYRTHHLQLPRNQPFQQEQSKSPYEKILVLPVKELRTTLAQWYEAPLNGAPK